jgi:hypothetical protein
MARSTDWDDDLDFEDDGSQGDIPDLRKAHRALKRQYKELQEQFQQVQKQSRERSVKDVLSAKGLNEKIAAFIPDNVTSPEDVAAWIDEYGDVFGAAPAQPTRDDPADTGHDPSLDGLGRIASSQQSGAPFTGDPDQIAALIASATDPVALNKILFGNPDGPKVV